MEKEVNAMIRDLRYEADLTVALFEKEKKEIEKIITEANRKLLRLREEHERDENAQQVAESLPLFEKEGTAYGAKPQKVQESLPLWDEFYGAGVNQQNIQAVSPIISGEALPVHQEIITMYQNGLNPDFIAEKTGLTQGEVQLIIGLNNSR